MRTRTAPWDYAKPRKATKPTEYHICDICGNYVVDTSKGIKCLTCTNTHYVEVPEWLVDTVRCGLWMIQYERSLFIAGKMPDIGGACELNWEGTS